MVSLVLSSVNSFVRGGVPEGGERGVATEGRTPTSFPPDPELQEIVRHMLEKGADVKAPRKWAAPVEARGSA